MMMNKSVMRVVVTFLALSIHTGLTAAGGPKRKALIVGLGGEMKTNKTIELTRSSYETVCRNVTSMKKICNQFGFKPERITVVQDNHTGENSGEVEPRSVGVEDLRKIIREWTSDAKPGDTYLFYYSGHGRPVPITAEIFARHVKKKGILMSEERKENILELLKEQKSHNMWDAERIWLPGMACNKTKGSYSDWYPDLKYDLIQTLPKGATVIMILDCCYSGGVAHLKYNLAKPFGQNGKCEWDEVELGKRSEALAISFGACQTNETITSYMHRSHNADHSSIFTSELRDMLELNLEIEVTGNKRLEEKSVAEKMQSLAEDCHRLTSRTQNLTVSTNDQSLDLTKLSFHTLLTGSICDENGLKPEYRQIVQEPIPEPQPTKPAPELQPTKPAPKPQPTTPAQDPAVTKPKAKVVIKEDKDGNTHVVEHAEGLKVTRLGYREKIAGPRTCILTKGTKLCIETEEDSSSSEEGEAKTYLVKWKVAGKKQIAKMDVALIDRVKPL